MHRPAFAPRWTLRAAHWVTSSLRHDGRSCWKGRLGESPLLSVRRFLPVRPSVEPPVVGNPVHRHSASADGPNALDSLVMRGKPRPRRPQLGRVAWVSSSATAVLLTAGPTFSARASVAARGRWGRGRAVVAGG